MRFILAVCLFAFLVGCRSTSYITEYNSDGTVARQITTRESLAKTVMESVKNKTVVMWSSGWVGYISVSMSTTEDPTPTGKIFAGKVTKGYMSILPNQKNISFVPSIIDSSFGYKLNLSQDGISEK